jgi:DNA-binding CsgD family transcriptional regulator
VQSTSVSLMHPAEWSAPPAPKRLATDLCALMQRLGIDAVICDRDGIPLATTPDAVSVLSGSDIRSRRAAEVRIGGHLLCGSVPAAPSDGAQLDLTPRQRRVVELIAQGLRNREIADALGISLHTVRRHVEGLLRRLQVNSRAAAVVLLQQSIPMAPTGPRRVA